MFLLALFWLLTGLLTGFLAFLAQLSPTPWTSSKWSRILGSSIIFSLCGGWLGYLLFGGFFSLATALWVSIIGIVIIPWGWASVKERLHA